MTDDARLTDEELERIGRAHKLNSRMGHCTCCNQVWPCDARRLHDEVRRLREEDEAAHDLIQRQAGLLTEVVNIVRGDPGPMKRHSHHDAPERVRTVIEALNRRLDKRFQSEQDLRQRLAAVERDTERLDWIESHLGDWWGWCVEMYDGAVYIDQCGENYRGWAKDKTLRGAIDTARTAPGADGGDGNG